MKERVMQLPKAAVVFIGMAVAALFLIIMNVTSGLLFRFVSLPGYGNSMLGELLAGVTAFLFLLFFGYARILKEKGQGFLKGFYIGGFMTGYCCLELAAQLYMQMMSGERTLVPVLHRIFFVTTMFLIGWAEELVFRGVILNLFLDRFGRTKKGILQAVVISGILFGAVHLTNVFQGVTPGSAAVQAINASLLGVIFGAIYVRSGNIWLVILYHAAVDFAGLMGSGLFGVGTTAEQINQMSAINLIAVPILLAPCVVLLRPKKLSELEQQADHVIVFETYKEADSDSVVSLILGMVSIMTGFMGYGLGIGITGLLAAVLSKRVKPENNGTASIGMVLSVIGMALSVVGMILLSVLYANLDGIYRALM